MHMDNWWFLNIFLNFIMDSGVSLKAQLIKRKSDCITSLCSSVGFEQGPNCCVFLVCSSWAG